VALSSFDDLKRTFRANRRSIASGHREDVIDLRHVDQSREEWDVLSRETVGIARAIPPLVEVADRSHHLVQTGADQDPLADHRVFLEANAVVGGG